MTRFAVLFALVALLVSLPSALASHTPAPTAVTIAGSLQSELGCPGDWQEACAATHLTYDATDDVWQRSFAVPAGAWEYKAPLSDSWAENYGRGAQRDGPNIALNLAATTTVKFYYDHKSHWVTDDATSTIAVAPGSFQSELGCPGDWQPDCLRSWLQDTDGDGTYTFETAALPAGSYETKVAIDESWDENYGQGGVPGGANIAFTVPAAGSKVVFTYDATTHVLRVWQVMVQTGTSSGTASGTTRVISSTGHPAEPSPRGRPCSSACGRSTTTSPRSTCGSSTSRPAGSASCR